MGDTDKQCNGQLIVEYQHLKRIRRSAEKENAVETVKLINEKMELIKLELRPTKLPE